jgi:D-3-phosphoglycerate dehydrogenase
MKILATRFVNPYVLDTLRQMHDVVVCNSSDEMELCRLIADCEVLVVEQSTRISKKVLGAATRLLVIAHIGASLDNIDIDYVLLRGIRLLRVPQGNLRAMAETSFGVFMALSGRMPPADQLRYRGQWFNSTLASYWMRGKTFGIIGAGEVSSYLARMAQLWGMHVRAALFQTPSSVELSLRERGIQIGDIESVFAHADMICIHLPKDPQFHGLVDAPCLQQIKSSSYVVNMASPYIFDLHSLIKVLHDPQGIVRFAQNVTHHQSDPTLRTLLNLPNVMMVPYDFQQDFTNEQQMSSYLQENLAQYGDDTRKAVAL